MRPPRISVLLPCFNDGAWIDEALDSVFAQTFADFEIVVVDDGSTDAETIQKLQSLQKPRTTVFRTENRGLPAARNYAAARACGELFCALDSDDRLAPEWFERALGVLDTRPEIAFVSHWLETFGDQQWVWTPERCDLPALLARNTINGAALVRRAAFEAVDGYEESMRDGCEDWDFWLRIVEQGFEGVIVPEVLFYYRRRADSMSRVMTDDRGYPRPLVTLLRRHADHYRQYVTELLTESEAESTRVRGEVVKLERDVLTVLAPGLARAREELSAVTSKAASYELLDRLSAERNLAQEALAELTGVHRDLVASYGRLHRDHAALTEVRDAAVAARDRLETLTSRLSGDVGVLQREVAALRGSLSWRATAILRQLYSWFQRKP